MNLTLFDHVDADELDSTWSFRKGSRDVLVIDDDIAHDFSSNKPRMKGGFQESRCRPRFDLFVAFSKQLAAKFVLPSVRSVSAEPAVKVFGVVCIQLSLHDDFW